LLSAPTVKVDPADTGGASGQVVSTAFGVGGVAVGGAGSGTGASSKESALPGLLSFENAPRKAGRRAEPPLAEQPSQINDEAFLD